MSISINTRSLEDVSPSTPAPDTGENTTSQEQVAAESSGFDAQLRALLSASGGSQVNEEELFAAIIQERLQDTKGDSVAEQFASSFASRKAQNTRSDGYVNVEKSANEALADVLQSGAITQAEHDEIFEHSFMAAQLDSNTSALYDGRGGEGDATVATADLESALLMARTAIEALENGELPPNQLGAESEDSGADELSSGEQETVTPKGNSIDGGEGFVFKPKSESDHKLVILLPQVMTGKVEDLLLKDSNDNIVERGRGTGVANGNREHFRFDRAGGDYPNDLTVEVRMTNGDVRQYEIPNPSERYD